MAVQLLLVALILVTASKGEEEPISYSKCRSSTKCGSVDIPFPFGTSKECSLDPHFVLTCNKTTQSPFWANLPVQSISLDGTIRMSLPVSKLCYHNETDDRESDSRWKYGLGQFYLSPTGNKFTVVGVNTIGVVMPQTPLPSNSFSEGRYVCLALGRDGRGEEAGSCSGVGCCETPIKKPLSNFSCYVSSLSINSNYYHGLLAEYPCGYAFLVEDGGYHFSSKHLNEFPYTEFPVVLNWAVGNQTCEVAKKNASAYACKSEHSVCHNATVGTGYHCRCADGFDGNAYLPLPHGCQDKDECKESHDCDPKAQCYNHDGGYSCRCKKGYKGDGKKNGEGCKPKPDSSIILITTLSVSLGILTLLGGSFYVNWACKKRRFIKLKEQIFQQNAGLLLQQQIAKHKWSTEMVKIFTAEEIKEATNNFDKDRILGRGGQGIVYKGVSVDNRIVAIKMSKIS